jgi:pseudouridine 5'-phosphatase
MKPATNKFSTILRGVAFDMDGLLLNTEDLYGEVAEILLGRRGKTYREDVRQQMIGLPAPQAFGVMIAADNLTESWQELQRETDEIFEEILPSRLQLMPGVEQQLRRLAEDGIRRCVATSSTRAFATKALSMVGILDEFEFVLTAADVPRGKPYPDIYQESAKRFRLPTDSMLVLEDSETGTKAGVASGAYVVSVPNEHTKRGNFEGAQWIANGLLDPRFDDLQFQT